MQYQFLLDVTGKYANIYIIKEENSIIYEAHYLNEKNLSHKLTEYIEISFRELNISYPDINKIYLVYGPGKFSGMRISSILVRTWSCIFKPEIYIINKLFYIAKSFPCICVVEADGNKFYATKYSDAIQNNDLVLFDNEELKNFLKKEMSSIIYYDRLDEVNDISARLHRFKEDDGDFVLDYHKPPC